MIVGVIALVAVLGVLIWRSRSSGAPKYRTADLSRGAIESVVSATGTIRPVEQVQVGSQVSGTVERIFADYNSRVRAGQVILQLERSSFLARVAQAEAAVAKAEATVRDGERVLARAEELFKQNYVSQAELDNARVTLQQRRADLKQASAQLQSARVDLAYTTIRSPIDGVVIARSVDVGQTVAASLQAPQLFLIANDLRAMQVETRIDEADIGQLRPGLPVTFTVDAFPDREFEGSVAQVRLEPVTDQNVVTYTTVISTENPDLRLRPGMTANVTVRIERREDVLRAPNAALRFRPPDTGARGGQGGGAMAAGMGQGGRQGGGNGLRSGEARGGAARAGGDSARASRGARRGAGSRAAAGASRGAWNRGGTAAGAADLVRRGDASGDGRALRTPESDELTPPAEVPAYRPGAVYVLKNGKPERVGVMTGITDGALTEIQTETLKEGDKVVVGLDQPARAAGSGLQPPPGMGGFRGPGGGGGRGGR